MRLTTILIITIAILAISVAGKTKCEKKTDTYKKNDKKNKSSVDDENYKKSDNKETNETKENDEPKHEKNYVKPDTKDTKDETEKPKKTPYTRPEKKTDTYKKNDKKNKSSDDENYEKSDNKETNEAEEPKHEKNYVKPDTKDTKDETEKPKKTPYTRPSTTPATPSYTGGGVQCEMLKLLNQVRNKYRRSSVTGDRKLDSAAKRECDALARGYGGKLSHTADGSTPGTRVSSAGYAWNGVAENIASNRGYGINLKKANDQWVGSSGHLKNMVGSTYVHAGHAACQGRDGYYYYVQVLASGGSYGSQYTC